MQIIITVGEEGRASARVLGETPSGETLTSAVEADEDTIDAGAAPAVEEDLNTEPAAISAEIELEAVDGGAAPSATEETEELLAAAVPEEGSAAEEAGAAPTISDVFPTEPGTPRLRPVD